MKMKTLIATLLVLTVAAPAMAFNVEWHGDFNNRFAWSNNAVASFSNQSGEGYATNYINNTNSGTALKAVNFEKNNADSDFLGEIKYRMWLTAQDDDKKVKGTVAFEFGGLEYGAKDKATFAGDKNVFELRWAYTDFEMPGDAATRVYLGLQPVGYNKFLWSDNAAGVKLVRKSGDFSYSLGWFRDDVQNSGQGGSTKLSNDDAYAADVTWAAKDLPKLNAFVLYLEEGKESFATGSTTTAGTAIIGFSDDNGNGIQDVGEANVVGPTSTTVANSTSFMDQQLWYGAAIDGQAGPVFYGATFIKEDGELTADSGSAFPNALFPAGRTSLDRDAWLANVEGTVKLDKARVKLGWLYSTGDDNPNDDKVENFSNIDAYMGGFGSVVVFDSFADDNTMVTAPYYLDKGLNMVYAGADFDLSDKTSVGASYLWINAAEDIDYGSKNPAYDFDKEIGHEFSVRGSYKITKNLSAGIEAGYLIAGDGLDGSTQLATGNARAEADDIIRTDASIRLKF